MDKRPRKSRVTEKNAGRKRKELSLGALEIASLAQEVIRQRMERALQKETELDELMELMLKCATVAEDKAAAKAIITRFDAIKIEDVSKVLSILKACASVDSDAKESVEGESIKLKFEDLYG